MAARTKKKSRSKSKKKQIATESADEIDEETTEDGFNYIAELKPLHIRRGFINMTPQHWPFFSTSSRMTTRTVTVYYEGTYDKKCNVWRLSKNDQARLVLTPSAQKWLEENFNADDRILLTAVKLDDEEIQISLKAVA